mmetsp:Transcript_20820/g.31355  ORF Transcript_20820/g.31355 Transcript_20820/m.31355 type:complete len:296 (+) Transcript_20820:98-985(+)
MKTVMAKRNSKTRLRDEEFSKKSIHSEGKELQSDKESESSDDEELLAAAAQWAQYDTLQESIEGVDNNHLQSEANSSEGNKILSLHLTNLPFDTTEYDIRSFFEIKGCLLASVRLVYDRALDGGKAFRGVAFLDLVDKKSYEIAQALTRSVFQGRKINIRPTKTKEELADIVSRTRELVAEKIKTGQGVQKEKTKRKSKDKGRKNKINTGIKEDEATRQEMDDGKCVNDSNISQKKRGKKQEVKEDKATRQQKDGSIKKNSKSDRKQTPKKRRSDGKLTKKERNRRAAIILSRRK